jgi:NADH-quinone oxidoreductase subunit K
MNTASFLIVGAALFSLGAIGFLVRRNLILMFLSAELMLQGVALNFVAFSRQHGDLSGQVFVLFIIAVAAAEAALALAMILMLYRRRGTLDVSVWQDLREPGLEMIVDLDEPKLDTTPDVDLPRLPPAGVVPAHREASRV